MAVKTSAVHSPAATPVSSGQNAARGSGSTAATALLEHIIHSLIG